MSRSRRAKRIKKEPMDIDITSLLDILVILLVFLLKSYNASNLKVDLVKNLDMATSKSKKLGDHSVMLQIDSNRDLYINNILQGNITESSTVAKIENYLESSKKEQEQTGAKKDKRINLIFDKNLQYQYVKNIMHISANKGFPEFKLIVKATN